MKLIIRRALALEAQQIDLTSDATVELDLGDGNSLCLRSVYSDYENYHRIDVKARTRVALGDLLVLPTAANAISLLLPREPKESQPHE